MPNRGKLVVLGFFFLGLALAGGAMWYHFAKTRWAMTYWGTESARLIVRAPEVEVWQLSTTSNLDEMTAELAGKATDSIAPARKLEIAGQTFFVTDQRPLAAAPGLIHMRMALVEDANFDTQASQPTETNWDYAFRFSSPTDELIVAIDSEHGFVRAVGEGADRDQPIASIAPIASGLKRFLEEQFPEPEDKATEPKKAAEEPAEEDAAPMAD